jgi:hypothetical protein
VEDGAGAAAESGFAFFVAPARKIRLNALVASRIIQGGENMKRALAICTGLTLGITAFAACGEGAQNKESRPSPPAKATCSMAAGKTITVDYSSPRMKGRKIFGGLVPFGEIWRAGANEATTFITDTDVTVGGTAVPAGSYTIFTIPGEGKWTLVISKKTGEWGTAYPGPSNDLARVEMKVSKLPAAAENFTIAFDPSGAVCTLRMEWETTRASVDISKK